MKSFAAFILAASASLTGCAQTTLASGGYCAPPFSALMTDEEDAAPPPGASRQERLAALVGLRSALVERATGGPVSLETRLRVLERLEVARLAIAATSAELDCEGERAEQAADYLTHKTSNQVQALTVGSVAAAALTAIAGVLLSTRSAPAATQDAVGIGGGVVTSGLALGSLYVRPRVELTHPRNLLGDVWTGPARSSVYPSVIWSYLTRPEFSNEQRVAIREKVVARWKRFDEVVADPRAVELVFGAGGLYDSDTLRARAQMLDEVKAEVELETQDFEALASALLTAAPATRPVKND